MSEPQPSKSPETNAGEKPATAGGGMASVAAVGARLAELRRTKGWSVDDVSARLKVAAPKLQALEAGDTSQLPGTTFALGLVRSYAKMLGVDPEPFAQALRREKGVPEVDLSMPASAGTDLPRGRVSIPLGGASRGRPWLWAVAAVMVALVAAAMWRTGGDSSNWLARFKSSGAGEAASAAHAQREGAASDLPASAAVSRARRLRYPRRRRSPPRSQRKARSSRPRRRPTARAQPSRRRPASRSSRSRSRRTAGSACATRTARSCSRRSCAPARRGRSRATRRSRSRSATRPGSNRSLSTASPSIRQNTRRLGAMSRVSHCPDGKRRGRARHGAFPFCAAGQAARLA